MKKYFLGKKITAIAVAALFWGCFTFFAVWLFRRYSVSPTFPYYYDLLLHTKDAAYAVGGYFDGIHYLRLAKSGYVDTGTQAFFPLYPLLIRFLSHLSGGDIYQVGIAVSFLSLCISLYLLWLLFPSNKLNSTLSLLLFPTSFFLLGVYTESLYLALSLGFFLALKKNRLTIAAILASVASATRLVGVILIIIYLIKLYQERKTQTSFHSTILALISAIGISSYLTFLYFRFHDPFMFVHVQSMFGANRSSGEIILLPQVIYRYAKMILTVQPHDFVFFRIVYELVFYVAAFLVWIKYFALRSPLINTYIGLSLLIPTLSGTLSSIPRYLLVLVPFIIPAKIKLIGLIPYYFICLVMLIILFRYFAYGSFVA